MRFEKDDDVSKGQILETDPKLHHCNYNMLSQKDGMDGQRLETKFENISLHLAVNACDFNIA